MLTRRFEPNPLWSSPGFTCLCGSQSRCVKAATRYQGFPGGDFDWERLRLNLLEIVRGCLCIQGRRRRTSQSV